MTILITADLHLNDNPRDAYRHNYVKNVIPVMIQQHKVKALLILGDLTEEKDRHGAELNNKMFSYIHSFSELCQVIILRGNHDYLTPDIPFFKSLGRLRNVLWVNEPEKGIHILPGGNLFLPHARDYKKAWRGIDIQDYKFVFTHNTFKGAVSDTGRELDGIPVSIFGKDQTVISGDVHVAQKVGVVEYVGAPFDISFNPVRCERHMILMADDGKVSYIPCEVPRKVTLDVALGEDMDVSGINVGDMVKVRVHLKPGEDLGSFRSFREGIVKELEGCMAMVQPVMDKGGVVNVSRKSKKSDEEVLQAYAGSLGVSKKVVRVGLKLMEGNA